MAVLGATSVPGLGKFVSPPRSARACGSNALPTVGLAKFSACDGMYGFVALGPLGWAMDPDSRVFQVLHHSRNSATGTQRRYYASTAVLLVEVIKLVASLLLATHHTSSSHPTAPVSDVILHLLNSIFAPESWKLIVPAALYTLQNSLVYAAISNLDAVTFQVTYQLKILTTVLFSILLLGTSISLRQWLSLVLLTCGVALVQISGLSAPDDWLDQLKSLLHGHAEPTSSAFRGLMAVVAASLTSGLTCVYFEKLVKDSMSSVSLWTRNVQLSFFSLFPALFIGVLWQDGAAIRNDGFFSGYNCTVWITIGLQALGGLIVAVCIGYAGNVAKNFAASLSIVVSYAATALLFGKPMTLHVGIFLLLSTPPCQYYHITE